MSVNTGYKYGAIAFLKDGTPEDIDGKTVADAFGFAGDDTVLDTKASAILGFTLLGAAGTVDGVFTIELLRRVGAGADDYETSGWSFTIEPTAGSTVRRAISISAGDYNDFRVNYLNQSGISITLDATITISDIPIAVA
jgi:hypothetical protein